MRLTSCVEIVFGEPRESDEFVVARPGATCIKWCKVGKCGHGDGGCGLMDVVLVHVVVPDKVRSSVYRVFKQILPTKEHSNCFCVAA